MGCYLQMTPHLSECLGYGEVRGTYLGSGPSQRKRITARDGRRFDCVIDLFDAEKDRFPYSDAFFRTVLCCELLEHLMKDPMQMMYEIHRILKPGGILILTTPNAVSLRAVGAALKGLHPGFFPHYMNPLGDPSDTRHAREYTPGEIVQLLTGSGFTVERMETGPYGQINPGEASIAELLVKHGYSNELRGECIFAVGRKCMSPATRLPSWLYAN
jgi:SAM-dependent methyltransferase